MPNGIGEITVPEGPSWVELRVAIEEQFAQEFFWIRVSQNNAKVMVEGEVVSEDAKASIFGLIQRAFSAGTTVNLLLVTSPLYPASHSHLDFEDEQDTTASNLPIVRHPRISCDQEIIAGKSYVFEVDLCLEPDSETGIAPLTLDVADPNWEKMLVAVELISYELDIEPEDARKNITLFRDGKSKSAKFAAKVVESVPLSGVNVRVIFSTDGRVRGFATRVFEVKAASGEIPPAQGANSRTSGDFMHDASPPPSLTVKISHDPNLLGHCIWSFEAPAFRHLQEVSSMPRMQLGSNAKAFFQDKFAQVKTLDEGRHLGTLKGIGEHIWSEGAPEEFRQLYLKMYQALGNSFPIQIITDEPHVPWELMHPKASDDDDFDHLCMTHPIGRWTMSRGLTSSIPKGGIASFVPEYDDGPLPAAVQEGKWLCAELGASAFDATYRGFTQCLNSPPATAVALLHFAGHGAGDEAAPQERGLRMKDGWVPLEEINSSVKLGRRDCSLVILNACHAGNQSNVLGALHGWPSAFIKVGFGGVVAPLWAVQDETACAVMKMAVTSLYCDGQPLGAALTDARRVHQRKSAAAFSYVLYGDVMATMTS